MEFSKLILTLTLFTFTIGIVTCFVYGFNVFETFMCIVISTILLIVYKNNEKICKFCEIKQENSTFKE